jgi:hypothetical protein
VRKLNLDELKNGMPGLSEAVGCFILEAAIVCLTTNGHEPGVKLKVSGKYSETFEVVWSDGLDEQALRSWKDMNEATEYGATALALLLVVILTEFAAFARAPQMSSADYVLVKKAANDGSPAAYLEVSGILKEAQGNTLQMRLTEKKRRQKELRDENFPVLIVIAEFSVPKAIIAKS